MNQVVQTLVGTAVTRAARPVVKAEWGRLVIARLTCALLPSTLAACSVLPNAGPSMSSIRAASGNKVSEAAVRVVDVNDAVAMHVAAYSAAALFSSELGNVRMAGATIGRGDILDISILEAPPAVLFAATASDSRPTATQAGSRGSDLPEQMVDSTGAVFIPFVGKVVAAGRTTSAIAEEIRGRLIGKAHDPQVVVRLSRNATSNVTIVGEVTTSLRMPLTAKGERLLDALASAGGVKQPVGKMTIQVTRGDKVSAMPLQAVIRDPLQNVYLQPDDVITLLFQPYSFTVLGAARANQEIPFEGTGLTLSQALGRMGGLDDQRANPKGVFIFRFEDPKVFEGTGKPGAKTKDGKVPVIYRVNMRNPTTLFVAQSFPIKDKDVIYISNAPLADFAKFLQAVSQIVYPIAVIQTTNIF